MSTAQVSTHASIIPNMQPELGPPELVRCVACHEIYEQLIPSAEPGQGSACPCCGAAAWLAVSIPLEETAAPLPA